MCESLCEALKERVNVVQVGCLDQVAEDVSLVTYGLGMHSTRVGMASMAISGKLKFDPSHAEEYITDLVVPFLDTLMLTDCVVLVETHEGSCFCFKNCTEASAEGICRFIVDGATASAIAEYMEEEDGEA